MSVLPELSVVIPATDQPPTLARAIASVEAASGPHDELIVATDGAGPAAARNGGAQLARGSILVFVDSDVELHPDALDRVRAAFRADPGLTAVFGSYDDTPSAAGTVSRFRNLLHHHVHQRSAGEATTFWAGLGAVRREPFLAAGGFDARSYPTSMMEDIELGMRLSASGARIVLDPALRARHLKRWTLGSMVRTDLTRRGIPWIRMLIARRDAPPVLNLSWRHRVTALAYTVATVAAIAQLLVYTALLLVLSLTLNRHFHVLLFRRGGLRLGAAGIPLHLIHHLTSALSVPIGAATYAYHVVRGRPAGAPHARLPALENIDPPRTPTPAPAAGTGS